ncbi:MAG: sulfurtransferase [Myxococcota bacterium]
MSASFGPLVTTTELAAWLEAGAPVVVLDTTWALDHEGPDSPLARYRDGHIPGARHFDLRRVADDPSPLHDTVCSATVFEAYARVLGLTDEHLVCCSHGSFSGAARAFWLFRLFGHDRVSILDGGMAQWRAEGRPLSTDVPDPAPGGFTATVRDALFCDVAGFERASESGVQTIDARPAKFYSGEADFFAHLQSPASGRPGRFEGALHLPSGAVTRDDGRLLPEAELRQVVQAAGIDPLSPSVATCSLGVGAAAAAFVLHLLGNTDVALFDGSWEAWSTRGDAHPGSSPIRPTRSG